MPMEAPLSVEACVDQYAGKGFRSIGQTTEREWRAKGLARVSGVLCFVDFVDFVATRLVGSSRMRHFL